MPKYLFQWTEIDYLEAVIEADSQDEADMIFSDQRFQNSDEPITVDTEFHDGPVITEIDNYA